MSFSNSMKMRSPALYTYSLSISIILEFLFNYLGYDIYNHIFLFFYNNAIAYCNISIWDFKLLKNIINFSLSIFLISYYYKLPYSSEHWKIAFLIISIDSII